MPLSRRFLQDSLTLPRYNASSAGASVETEESISTMTSPLARRLMQDSHTFCYDGSLTAEEDNGYNDDYTVDLIHMLRHQITSLQEKLHHEKLITAQHNAQQPPVNQCNGPKSLHDFLERGPGGSYFVPKSNAVRADLAVVSTSSRQDTASEAEAGIQTSIVQLTASLERLQHQKEQQATNGGDGAVLTNSVLLRVIAEQVELAKTLIMAQKKETQEDNHQLQAALNANTEKIAQIERRLKKPKKRSPCR
jgi:hypothetical protein